MSRVLFYIGASLFAGCGGELTEIFACYTLDPSYDSDVSAVNVSARTTDDRLLYQSAIALSSSSPSSQGFVQATADGVELRLEATIPNQPDPLGGAIPVTLYLTQTIVVDFQPGRVVDVTLSIDRRCAGVSCASGQTCVEGNCLPDGVDGACLADRGDEPPPSCMDPRVAGACDPAP
jgi:hypothetical protein